MSPLMKARLNARSWRQRASRFALVQGRGACPRLLEGAVLQEHLAAFSLPSIRGRIRGDAPVRCLQAGDEIAARIGELAQQGKGEWEVRVLAQQVIGDALRLVLVPRLRWRRASSVRIIGASGSSATAFSSTVIASAGRPRS